MNPSSIPSIENLPQLPLDRRGAGQERPVTSIVAILRPAPGDTGYPSGTYLLIRRIKPPYLHLWALVGGKWDFGESLEDAVKREVEEETGLQSSFLSLRGIMNERIVPLDDSTPGGHYILFVCELQITGGSASEKHEGPVSWFTSEQLKLKAEAGEMIATDFALLQAFREPSPGPVYIEAEVHSGQEQGRQVDRITRFELI
jgi:8-oxo-dGTP diphosphatase